MLIIGQDMMLTNWAAQLDNKSSEEKWCEKIEWS